MTSVRTIIWLLVTILGLSAAHFLLNLNGSEQRLVKRTSLLASAAEADRLTVMRGGSTVVSVSKRDGWRIEDPFDGAADEAEVMRLLDAIATAPVKDAMTDAELLRLGRTRRDFLLDVPSLAITLERIDGSSARIAIGSKTPSGDGVYVTVSGENAVLVVSTNVLAAVEVTADQMRSKTLCSVDAESIAAFDIRRGQTPPVSFARKENGWSSGDTAASAEKIHALLSAVAEAKAVGFVWPSGATNEAETASTSLLASYGLDGENSLSLSMRDANGIERRLIFGREAANGLVYALAQDGALIVTVDAELKDLAANGAEGFVEPRIFPLEVASVRAFAVADGETTYAMSRDADGRWQLATPVAAPADGAVVEALLGRILSLGAADREENGVQISFGTNSTPVAVSRESTFGEIRPEDLRSKTLLAVDPVEVRRLVAKGDDPEAKPKSVVYDLDRRLWNVESSNFGEKVSEVGIASVLSAINPLVAIRVEKLKVSAAELADYGLDEPSYTLSVDRVRADAVRKNVFIGDETDDGYYATIGTADAVFVLAEETVKRLSAPLTAEMVKEP